MDLPRDKLVVVTGVSGSGKSSLVFDTLYAEGHRRYVESLSSYARQFLARLQKPDVDSILGLSPAIAIEQRTITSNPRSTVGSITEIFDYLRLLFARLGKTISPISGEEVTADSVTDVVEYVLSQPEDTRVYILAHLPPLRSTSRTAVEQLVVLLQMGFQRLWVAGEVVDIEDLLESGRAAELEGSPVTLVVDRFKVRDRDDEDFRHRIADSIQTAFNEGAGRCAVAVNADIREFSELFERDGIAFERPSVNLFNRNNPVGACPTCEGFGRVMGTDPDLVLPNPYLTLRAGAVRPFQTPAQQFYQDRLEREAPKAGLPLDIPLVDFTPNQKRLLWRGNEKFHGLDAFFRDIEEQAYKVQYRVMLARYRGYTDCPACEGVGLRPEATYIQVHGHTFGELQALPVEELQALFAAIPFTAHDRSIAGRILHEVESRLQYLVDVGVGYLQLNRRANTLSGGETQRINLATSLGSTLTGALYILDEPSIGLHPRDNDRLLGVLEGLRDLGNSVIVVEHDDAHMRRADWLLDLGPRAGEHGGEVLYSGPPQNVERVQGSLTADYLSGKAKISPPKKLRKPEAFARLVGAAQHNLRNITAEFPLGVLCVVTGVSGSGKTTLVQGTLFPALAKALDLQSTKPGLHERLELPEAPKIAHVELVDQKAVGRNVRSNPVTYVGAYNYIRDLFAAQPAAKASNLKAAHFSFNVDGGRCDTCQGEGEQTVEMQFLPDVKLVCETCGGKRFKQVVLEVEYNGSNIYDVLELTVTEALAFFAEERKITDRLAQLERVGLGYVRLGQSTGTLSGGEAQRLKLASFLQRKPDAHTLYIFDEPTTGLHVHDVAVLLRALNDLVDAGNTVLVVEHHIDVIKSADWLLDLGPGGGKHGGELLYSGPPKGLKKVKRSATGQYL